MPSKPARQLQRVVASFQSKPAGVKVLYGVLLLCLVGATVRIAAVPGKYVRFLPRGSAKLLEHEQTVCGTLCACMVLVQHQRRHSRLSLPHSQLPHAAFSMLNAVCCCRPEPETIGTRQQKRCARWCISCTALHALHTEVGSSERSQASAVESVRNARVPVLPPQPARNRTMTGSSRSAQCLLAYSLR